jgi:hypothetical protein
MPRALALLIAVLTIAGCGGGDSTTTSVRTVTGQTGKPLTREQYIAEADSICGGYHPRLHDLRDKFRAAAVRRDYAAAADALQEAMSISRVEFDKLAAIRQPERDREVLGKLFDKADQAIALFESSIEPLRDENSDRFTTLADEASSAADQERGIATGYGFKVCGQD